MRPPLDRAAAASLTPRLQGLGDPEDAAALLGLLRTLYAVGRRDLPLGRLFEGHVDALQIVERYGTAAQADAAERVAAAGGLFGVWNADLPGRPLQLIGERLRGGKAFASGAGLLTHALVTVDAKGGRQLILVDLARTVPAIDRSWWQVRGMQRSETHLVEWTDAAIADEDRIGAPGDYLQEPWFSGGALRFAAVQAGGIAGIVDALRDHLVARGRADDPHQSGRLAQAYLAGQAAADAVARAAQAWSRDRVEATLAHVAAARVAVYDAGEQALSLAEAAAGLEGMFSRNPLAESLSDLTVYLRQPNPDGQRMRLGTGVASALLTPTL